MSRKNNQPKSQRVIKSPQAVKVTKAKPATATIEQEHHVKPLPADENLDLYVYVKASYVAIKTAGTNPVSVEDSFGYFLFDLLFRTGEELPNVPGIKERIYEMAGSIYASLKNRKPTVKELFVQSGSGGDYLSYLEGFKAGYLSKMEEK